MRLSLATAQAEGNGSGARRYVRLPICIASQPAGKEHGDGNPAVASAGAAFEQLSGNVVRHKQRDHERLKALYNVTLQRPVTLRAAPAESGKVPARSDGRARAALR